MGWNRLMSTPNITLSLGTNRLAQTSILSSNSRKTTRPTCLNRLRDSFERLQGASVTAWVRPWQTSTLRRESWDRKLEVSVPIILPLLSFLHGTWTCTDLDHSFQQSQISNLQALHFLRHIMYLELRKVAVTAPYCFPYLRRCSNFHKAQGIQMV
jgi:hypothetical protein